MSDQDRSNVDAQFAEIIAHWAEDDALASTGAGPWPEQEGYGPRPADRAQAPDTSADPSADTTADTSTGTGHGTDAPPRAPGTDGARPGAIGASTPRSHVLGPTVRPREPAGPAGTTSGRALVGAGPAGAAPARRLAGRPRGALHPGAHGTATCRRPAVLGHPHRPHRRAAAPALPHPVRPQRRQPVAAAGDQHDRRRLRPPGLAPAAAPRRGRRPRRARRPPGPRWWRGPGSRRTPPVTRRRRAARRRPAPGSRSRPAW